MTLLLQYTLIFSSVLLLVALGGCFAEHSGVINIGLEGIMVIGALGGALVMKFLPVTVGAPVMVIVTILAAAVFGLLFSLLLAVAAINFKADQTITGTAMNMLATAGATVAVKAMNTAASGGNDVSSDIVYTAAKDLFIVRLGSFEFNWFMLVAAICLAASFVVLYKTRFGLRLRACGEHPQACETLGINVIAMRFWCVCISGFLSGLGGACVTMATSNQFRPISIVGQGFIAIAAVIFGKFRPQGALLGCLLFGFCSGLKVVLGGSSGVNMHLISMIPYVVTVIVLVLFVGKSHVPAANGKPYIKSK